MSKWSSSYYTIWYVYTTFIRFRLADIYLDWLIDLLIDYSLMSTEHYFSYIQDENTYVQWYIETTILKWGKGWANDFWLPLKRCWQLCRENEYIVFCSDLEIYKEEDFECARCVTFSKHIAHYAPWSGFL